jgi:hypothetical protein
MSFWKEIQKRIFPFIIALSALSVSASAAFYSVTGLSKLFAGAATAVLIMATSLEVSKLVIASLLYQYWKSLNKLLRVYLTVAASVLVLITSAGIYGFLSGAYQETASKSGILDKEVELIELKKNRFVENREYFILEKKELDESITSLRDGLANNRIQYRDSETGQIITTTSSSTRRSLENQLETAISSRDEISQKIETATDSITSLEVQILDLESNTDLASELGPLKYISELTGTPMDKVINILMLVIIFVFDPLAISLVIASNFAFEKLSLENKEIKRLEEEKKRRELEEKSKLFEKTDEHPPTESDVQLLQKELEKLEKLRYEKHLREENLEKISNDSKLEKTPINKEQEDTTEKEEVLDTKTEADDVLYSDEVKPEPTPDTQKPRRLVYDSRDGRRNTKITRL